MRLLLVFALVQTTVLAQTVSVKNGNVFHAARNGSAAQITFSGLDSDPHFSLDQRLVAFVRRTPGLKIDTGMGDTDENELWIASTSGKEPPRRVLVGHPGGFKIDDNLVLAGFGEPQFSPDGSRIYFSALAWATQASFRMIDLTSGRVRFLYAGLDLEVVQTGEYAGYLVALKSIPVLTTARVSDTGSWTRTERMFEKSARVNLWSSNSSESTREKNRSTNGRLASTRVAIQRFLKPEHFLSSRHRTKLWRWS